MIAMPGRGVKAKRAALAAIPGRLMDGSGKGGELDKIMENRIMKCRRSAIAGRFRLYPWSLKAKVFIA